MKAQLWVNACVMAFCVLWIAGAIEAQESADKKDSVSLIHKLIKNLGADSFEERERAVNEIVDLGAPALDTLEAAQKGAQDADLKSRLALCVRKIEAVDSGALAYVSGVDGDVYLFFPRQGVVLRRVESKKANIYSVSWIRGFGLEVRHSFIPDPAKSSELSFDNPWRYAYADFLQSSALINNYSLLELPPSSFWDIVDQGLPFETEIQKLTGERFWKMLESVPSPNREQVAMTVGLRANEKMTWFTYLYSPSNKELKRIGEASYNMTWSSDGQFILSTDSSWPQANDKRVYCFNVATQEWKTVATKTASKEIPRMSPDSSRIAFVREVNEEKHVWLVDRNGKNEEDVAAGSEPKWSPNGDAIAFKDLQGNLVLLNLKDRQARSVCKVRSFDWSRIDFSLQSKK